MTGEDRELFAPARTRAGLACLLLTVLVALPAVAGPPVTLTRGPYLQLLTRTAVAVRWRTSAVSVSRVLWGSDPAQLDHVVTLPELVTEHEVRVEGVAPAMRYYYAVGTASTVLAGGDLDHFFRTAASAAISPPIRVWAIGDSGTGTSQAQAVRDAYLAFTGDTPTDAWLMLGDNAYTIGSDEQYQLAVFDTYPQLLQNTCLWPSIGNHDALSSHSATQTGPYFDNFTLPTAGEAGGVASGTEAYYSFDLGDVHLVVLDSADSSLDPDGAMLQWLTADLAANDRDWLVAYFHHPPYTKGSHDSDNPLDSGGIMFAVRENALPLLEAAGVDLVLSGHSHAYERSYLLHGHYGTSDTLDPQTMILDSGDGRVDGDGPYGKGVAPALGTVYVVAGNAGGLSGGPFNHPAMIISLLELGSVVLQVDGGRLDVGMLNDLGEFRDWFTIERPLRSVFADRFESGDTSRWSVSVP